MRTARAAMSELRSSSGSWMTEISAGAAPSPPDARRRPVAGSAWIPLRARRPVGPDDDGAAAGPHAVDWALAGLTVAISRGRRCACQCFSQNLNPREMKYTRIMKMIAAAMKPS